MPFCICSLGLGIPIYLLWKYYERHLVRESRPEDLKNPISRGILFGHGLNYHEQADNTEYKRRMEDWK